MTNGNKLPIELRSVYFQLRVKDLLRAKKFYEDLFGFEVTWFMSPKAGWCEFRLPGGDFRLGLNAVQEGEDFDPMWGRLTLDVKDLIATKKYLHEKGYVRSIGTLGVNNYPALANTARNVHTRIIAKRRYLRILGISYVKETVMEPTPAIKIIEQMSQKK